MSSFHYKLIQFEQVHFIPNQSEEQVNLLYQHQGICMIGTTLPKHNANLTNNKLSDQLIDTCKTSQ